MRKQKHFNEQAVNLNNSTTHVRSCSLIAQSSFEQVKQNCTRGEFDSATKKRVKAQAESDNNGSN